MIDGRTQVHSSGGGTQSIAIFALIIQGRLPRPDIIVMADTEREKSATWDYHYQAVVPALAAIGLEVVVIKKSDYRAQDLYSEKDVDLLIPAFTTQGGSVGKLPTFCSDKWKQRPVRRWLTGQGITNYDMWMGMSLDEVDRMASSGANGWRKLYPLIGYQLWGAGNLQSARLPWAVPMNRAQCYALITEGMGWPEPPKSSCWMCPNMGNPQWRHMRDTSPDDWQRAIELDEAIRVRDANVFLHSSGMPLALADLNDSQPGLFDGGCSSGVCFV